MGCFCFLSFLLCNPLNVDYTYMIYILIGQSVSTKYIQYSIIYLLTGKCLDWL